MPIDDPYMTRGDGAAEQADTSPGMPAAGAKAQEMAGTVMDKARDMAMSRLGTGKSRAAGSVSGLAASLRQAGQAMDQNTELPVGQYVHQAAEQLERLSQTLSEKEPEELLREAERFARRQPAVFLGLAFAGGLVAARFLKSSSGGASLRDRARDAYTSATAEDEAAGTATYRGAARVAEPVAERPAGSW